MTANDLLTVGVFDQWARALLERLPDLPAAPAPVVLYSKQKLAEVLDVHVDTVGSWLRKGKKGRGGQTVKLRAYQFTSEPRIPWPAVLAYHRGEDFDLDSLPAPLLAPKLSEAPYLNLPTDAPTPPLMRAA